MADLISRAAAIDAIISETIYPDRETIDKVCGASYSEDNGWVGGIRDAINAVEGVNAVDAVPVVRCRDCKYGEPDTNGFGEDMVMCQNAGNPIGYENWLMPPEFYCADGERRESE